MAKIKKAQKGGDYGSGYTPTQGKVDSLRAAAAKQLGTPAASKTLSRLKSAEAQEKREDAMKSKKKSMKMGGKMLKKQAATAIAMKAAGKKPKSMMKKGGKMSKMSKKK